MFFKKWLSAKVRKEELVIPSKQVTVEKIPEMPAEEQMLDVEAITDLKVLEDIALTAKTTQQRQAAVQKIEDMDVLHRIELASRQKDKMVHRLAKNKLQVYRDQQQQQQAWQDSAEKICMSLESHSHASIDNLYEPKWKLLQQQWQALPASIQALYLTRFTAANQSCEQQWQIYCEQQQTQQQLLAEQQVAHYEQEQACLALEQVEQQFHQTPLQTIQLPGLRALLITQQNRWQEAQESHAATAVLTQRFQQAQKNIKQALENFEKDQKKSVRKIQQDQVQEKNAEIKQRISQVIAKIENLLEAGSITEAAQALKALVLEDVPEQQKIQTKIRGLNAKIKELQGWQDFAVTPKKQALCEAMEVLIGADLPPVELAEKIKMLQEEWKQVGHVHSAAEQALWLRFKKAGDQAFEPCARYYAEQAQQRQLNAQQRQSLCEQLENYEQHHDWKTADWSAVLATLKLAKTQWRQYSPVNRQDQIALQTRFDNVVEKIQQRLNEEYEKNQRLKQRIIEQAIGLVKITDIPQAIVEVKKLQQAWQQVGLLPISVEKKLWQTFQQHCQAVFDRRQQDFLAQETERQQHQAAAEQLIEKLQQLVLAISQFNTEADFSHGRQQAEKIAEQFEQTFPLPKASAAHLQKQFQTAQKNFRQNHRDAYQAWQQKSYQALEQKAQLCAEFEQWILTGEKNEAAFDSFTQRWLQLGEVPAIAAEKIQARFDQAILAWQQDQQATLKKTLENYEKIGHDLILRMEILAGVDSPAEDSEKRMALQVNRLAETMSQGKNQSPEEEAKHLYVSWCVQNGGLLATAVARNWQQRFEKARQKLYAS